MQLAASSSSRVVGRYSEWHQQATAAAASSSMQAEAEVRSSRKQQQKERMNFQPSTIGVYVGEEMIIPHDPGHVSRSDFVCIRSCRVHMIDGARNPSSESALGHEISHF